MPTSPTLTQRPWGTHHGRTVSLFRLAHDGVVIEVSDYGALIVHAWVPDRHGVAADVVLGFATLEEYQRPGHSPYFGCVVGRFGNRIAGGQFALDGVTYRLATNNAPAGRPCHLHGGDDGFDRRLWASTAAVVEGVPTVALRLVSPAGDQGYPGELTATVTYRLHAGGVLRVDYTATTTAATPVNLTQHAYFQLAGHGAGSVLDHRLQVAGQRILAVDPGLIPTGELMPVAGTPFDFRTLRRVGEAIDADHPQLQAGAGYDHTWVLDHGGAGLGPCARLEDPVSGRALDVWTTEPGVQVYSGNFLPATGPGLPGKDGVAYRHRGGICLETQHFPDSPNQPAFPSTVVRPGTTWHSTTEFRFGQAG